MNTAWQIFFASSGLTLLGWTVTLLRSIDAKFADMGNRVTRIEANCPKCNYIKQ